MSRPCSERRERERERAEIRKRVKAQQVKKDEREQTVQKNIKVTRRHK
jgi:hypothetical protein